jgi:hypothetical protein
MVQTLICIPVNQSEYVYSAFSRFIINRILDVSVDDKFKVIKNDGLSYRLSKLDSIRHHAETSNETSIEDYDISYNIDIFDGEFIFEYNGVQIKLWIDSGKYKSPKICSTPDDETVLNKASSDMIVVCDPRYIYSQFGIIKLAFDSSSIKTYENMMKFALMEYDIYMETANHTDKYISLYFPDSTYWDMAQKLSKRKLSTIYLPEADKLGIIEDIKKFILPETQAIYDRLCVTYKRVYLFEGIPGAGKTSFIKALASEFGYNIASLQFNAKMDDTTFLRLLNNLPKKTFLLFEDMDCLFKSRKAHDTESNHVTLSGLLNGLDGIGTKHGLVCFITTNYKSHLDPALVRPGRVDKILTFDYVTVEQIEAIYKAYMWECFDETEFKVFYKAISDLRIKVNVSLLSQYLFGYYNNPSEAVKNIRLIRDSFNDSKIETTADDTDMYS